MRAKTLQIVWHSKEPVYSLDFHPNGTLVSGGADKEIKVWQVSRGADGYATVQHLSSLTGHEKTVNCVRFSPTGRYLASSGDGGQMLLWEPADKTAAAAPRGNLCEDEGEATWRRCPWPRGQSDDIMDLAWSPDGTALLSAAINHEAVVWDITDRKRGMQVTRFDSHKHFVQGAAWDPAQQFVVTQSADRTCKVYTLKPPAAGKKTKVSQYLRPAAESAKDLYLTCTLAKRPLAAAAPGADGTTTAGAKRERLPLFQDEHIQSFFRRPAWSPDGSILALPAGTYKLTRQEQGAAKETPATYLFARGNWAAPAMVLPSPAGKTAVAVRFCPVVFKRDSAATAAADTEAESAANPFAALPYKMVFAVATLDSVVVYDTLSTVPLAMLGHLHYDSITDLAWSSDGAFLAVSSRDCYCSIAAFDEGELGTPLGTEHLPPHIAKRVAAAQRVAEPLAVQVGGHVPAAPTLKPHSNAGKSAGLRPVTAPTAGAAAAQAAAAAAAGSAPPQAGTEQLQAATHGQKEAKAATVSGCAQPQRKRIQPEPVSMPAAARTAKAQELVPEAKKARHEDSDQGAGAMPVQERNAPARKRIAPESLGPQQPSNAAAAPVVAASAAAAAPARSSMPAPAGQARAPKRITPMLVGPTAAPPGPNNHTAESAFSGAAAGGGGDCATGRPSLSFSNNLPSASNKAPAGQGAGVKRITPTPIGAAAVDDTISERLGGGAATAATGGASRPAQQQSAATAGEVGQQAPGSQRRRITPMPVGASPKLPQGQEVVGGAAPAVAHVARADKPAAAGGFKGGFNIAALAAAAGKQTAQQSTQN